MAGFPALEQDPAFQALDPALKPRAREVYLRLIGDLDSPLPPAPSPARPVTPPEDAAVTRVVTRFQHEVERMKETHQTADQPGLVFAAGRVRVRATIDGTWSDARPGLASSLPWGSAVQTDASTKARVLLPDRGRVEMEPGSLVELTRGRVALRQGEAVVSQGRSASGTLVVDTTQGQLKLGPGGRVRVRPERYQALAGPIEPGA